MKASLALVALVVVTAGIATPGAASEPQSDQCARSPQGWWREVCVVDGSRLLVSPERSWGRLEIHPELTQEGWQWILLNPGAPYAAGEGCVGYSPGDVRCLDRTDSHDVDVVDVQSQRENGSVAIRGITAPLLSLIRVRGGPKDDRVAVEPGEYAVYIEGNEGPDVLAGAGAMPGRGVVIDGGTGDDRLTGTSGADRLTGGPGRDFITAGAGDDAVDAVDGFVDEVDCGSGADSVRAESFDRLTNCETRERLGFDLALYVPSTHNFAELVNEGTKALTDVELVVRMKSQPGTWSGLSDEAACASRLDRLRCTVGALEPGQRVKVHLDRHARVITGRGHALAPHDVVFSARAGEADEDPGNNVLEREVGIAYCSILEPGGGSLVGTDLDDRICGRTGADRIAGAGGNDWIDAGDGADLVSGGTGNDYVAGLEGDDRLNGDRGRDSILGGPGRDLIRARDGQRDRISCGSGPDRVLADRIDRVAPNCERVARR